MADATASNHSTGGRRLKHKGAAAQALCLTAAGEELDGEQTDPENPTSGVANGLLQTLTLVLVLWGFGSASLAEVLDWSRRSNLDAPAACASQGAMKFLGVQSKPRQVMSPNSSPKLPQNRFGPSSDQSCREDV